VARIVEGSAYRVLFGRPEGKRPLEDALDSAQDGV